MKTTFGDRGLKVTTPQWASFLHSYKIFTSPEITFTISMREPSKFSPELDRMSYASHWLSGDQAPILVSTCSLRLRVTCISWGCIGAEGEFDLSTQPGAASI